ncbi:unnamed protein product [Closterium sp. NIES-54]
MSSRYPFCSPPSRFSPHTSPPFSATAPHACTSLAPSFLHLTALPCPSHITRGTAASPAALLPSATLTSCSPHPFDTPTWVWRQGRARCCCCQVEPTIAAHLPLVSPHHTLFSRPPAPHPPLPGGAAGPLRRGGAAGAGAAAAGRSRYLLPTCRSSLHPRRAVVVVDEGGAEVQPLQGGVVDHSRPLLVPLLSSPTPHLSARRPPAVTTRGGPSSSWTGTERSSTQCHIPRESHHSSPKPC